MANKNQLKIGLLLTFILLLIEEVHRDKFVK